MNSVWFSLRQSFSVELEFRNAELHIGCISVSVNIITARNSSSRKVMFSQAFVIRSVHGEGVYPSMQWGRVCVLQHAMGQGVSAQGGGF